MNVDAIYNQRRERWGKLMQLRREADSPVCTCRQCGKTHAERNLKPQYYICPECGTYLNIPPRERIAMVSDSGGLLKELKEYQSKDPLQFPEYQKKLEENREKTGNADAIVTGICETGGVKTAIGVMDAAFLMGSMGTVVGEKIVELTKYAQKKKLPLLIFAASGGARMQEGLYSLMQMARTAAAIQEFKEKGGLFISFFTNPTTGGVSASFASLGDINIAEPDALICFAGPRVIEQTIGQKLPEGFQHAEFLQEHGMLDLILERKDQKAVLSKILRMHQRNGR